MRPRAGLHTLAHLDQVYGRCSACITHVSQGSTVAGADDQKTLREQQAAKLAQSGEMGPAQHDWMHHFSRPRFLAPTPASAPGGALVANPKEEPGQAQAAGQDLLSLHGPVRRQSYPPPHEDHTQVRASLTFVPCPTPARIVTTCVMCSTRLCE